MASTNGTMRKRVRIHRRKGIEDPEIIVIPMIDVMMFLLFFFMVASLAMAVQSGLPVNLPKASTSASHSAENITVTITARNQVFLNTLPVTLNTLRIGLVKLRPTAQSVIIINADKIVPHGMVVGAMDEARQAGVTRFAIATEKPSP